MAADLFTVAQLIHPGVQSIRELPWHLVRYEHTQELRSRLAERYAPASVNHQLSALRGVLKECWRLGLMSAEDYHRAADVENVRGHTEPSGRHVPMGELLALVAVCQADPSPIGVRDGALLAVAFTAGLRLSELVALEVADYRPENGELLVRRGKGHKQRRTYVTGGAQRVLDEWLAVRGDEPGAVFVPIGKNGTVGRGESD